MIKLKRKTYNWVDYTRRNDPGQKFFVELLKEKIKKHKYPYVFCFWTRLPDVVINLYKDILQELKDNNVLVLAQITVNKYKELEPGLKEVKLDSIVKELGSDHIRLRFDPIIPTYTTAEHFIDTIKLAKEYNIKRVITNFIVPTYKDVDKILKYKGIITDD